MKARRIIIAVCAVFMLIGMSAYAGGAGGSGTARPTVVTFWNGFTGPDRATVEALVERFNESQSEITIDMQIMPWDSFYQKLMPAYIAGTGPDLIGMDPSRVPTYAKAGRFEQLDSFLANSDALSREVLVESLLDASTVDGKLYGMPMTFASMVMYYNKDLFAAAGLDPENPPRTFSELEAAWVKLLQRDSAGNITVYPQAIAIRATVPMMPVFLWGYGAEVVTSEGKSGLNSPEARKAMTFVQRAFTELNVSPVGITGGEADELSYAGKAAIMFNGPWALGGYKAANINVGVAEVPAGPVGKRTWGGSAVLCMNSASDVKDSAWTFMEYWNSYESQKFWATREAFPPTRLDMEDDPVLTANEPMKVFIKSADYAKVFLAGVGSFGEIDGSVLTPLYESVARGIATPEAALQEAHEELNKILSE